MPDTHVPEAAEGCPKTSRPGTHVPSVTELAKQWQAVETLCNEPSLAAGAINSLVGVSDTLAEEIFRTPASSLEEVAIKLRVLAAKTEEGCLYDYGDWVRQAGDEWDAAYHAEMVATGAYARGQAVA
jgi:hypothetical protein